MNERDYPEGSDFVWVGCDREGKVGVFVTGGEGPVPAVALRVGRIAVEEIEGRLLELPATTSGRLIVPLKRPDDFMELARRGFFAYDWSDVHRTRSERVGKYEQIAAPEVPLLLAGLPSEVADLLDGIELDVSFLHEAQVDVARDLPCREPT